MRKIFFNGFILGILLLLNSGLNSQTNSSNDSLIKLSKIPDDTIRLNILKKLTWEYRHSDPLKSFEFGFEGLALADKLKSGKDAATLHNFIGVVAIKIKSLDKAKIHILKAYHLADSLNITTEKGYALNNLGEIYCASGNIDSAIAPLTKAIETFKSINDLNGLAFVYDQMGMAMRSQNKFDEAIKYRTLSLEIREKLMQKAYVTGAYQKLGIDLMSKGSYIDARNCFEKMDPKQLEWRPNFSIPYRLVLIGKTYQGTNELQTAIKYYNQGLRIADSAKIYSDKREAARLLSEVYTQMDEHKTALKFYNIYKICDDSVKNSNLIAEYKQLEMKIGFEQKYNYLEYKMQQDIDAQKLKLFWNRIVLYCFIAFLIILLVFITVYIRNYKTIAHKNSLLIIHEEDIANKNHELNKQNIQLTLQNEEIQSIIESLEEQKSRLVESEEKFRSLVELLPEAIFEMDLNGKLIYANDEFYRKLGYNPEDIQNGLSSNEIIVLTQNTIDQSFTEEISTQFTDKHVLKELEYQLLRKDKTSFPVLLSLSSVTNSERIAFRCVFVDITQRVENERKMQEALKDIRKKNKDITDSIEYALHIQNAVLPSGDFIASLFDDFFIINKPHTIVSGDFYYFSKKEGKIVLAISDCTGHGVPGGFMTMLGITQLNEIYNHDQFCAPNKALDIMRNQVIESLNQNISELGSKDGMDMLLGILDTETLKFEFSSANQTLLLLRNGHLEIFKGDKMPVGIYRRMNPFTSQEIQLQKGDTLYLFTDGIVDLFGGKNDRRIYLSGLLEMMPKVYHEKLAVQGKMIEDFLLDWQGENKQTDDMLMIGLQI